MRTVTVGYVVTEPIMDYFIKRRKRFKTLKFTIERPCLGLKTVYAFGEYRSVVIQANLKRGDRIRIRGEIKNVGISVREIEIIKRYRYKNIDQPQVVFDKWE